MSESRCRLGESVRKLREHERLSQRQLGLMVGLDRSYISRLERGLCSASFESIVRIAWALDVAPSQLLDDIPPPEGLLF